jgi:hypothetical protein
VKLVRSRASSHKFTMEVPHFSPILREVGPFILATHLESEPGFSLASQFLKFATTFSAPLWVILPQSATPSGVLLAWGWFRSLRTRHLALKSASYQDALI